MVGNQDPRLIEAKKNWQQVKNTGDYDIMYKAALRFLTLKAYDEYIQALNTTAEKCKEEAGVLYDMIGSFMVNTGDYEKALSYYKKSYDLSMQKYEDGYHSAATGYYNIWEALENLAKKTDDTTQKLKISFRYFEICNKLAKNESTDAAIKTIGQLINKLSQEQNNPLDVQLFQKRLQEIEQNLEQVQVVENTVITADDSHEQISQKYVKSEYFDQIRHINKMKFELSIDSNDIKKAIKKVMSGDNPGDEFEQNPGYMNILHFLVKNQQPPVSTQILDRVETLQEYLQVTFHLDIDQLCKLLIDVFDKKEIPNNYQKIVEHTDFKALYEILFREIPKVRDSLKGEIPYYISLIANQSLPYRSITQMLEMFNQIDDIYNNYSLLK